MSEESLKMPEVLFGTRKISRLIVGGKWQVKEERQSRWYTQ